MSPAFIVKAAQRLAGPFELTLITGNCAAITGPSDPARACFFA
jgi:hypothetical protein